MFSLIKPLPNPAGLAGEDGSPPEWGSLSSRSCVCVPQGFLVGLLGSPLAQGTLLLLRTALNSTLVTAP